MIRSFAALSIFALAACASTTDVDNRNMGTIQTTDVDAALVAPDSVNVGQSFTVGVTTIGLDSCWKTGQTDVTQESARATITPFDVDTGDSCYDVVTPLHRNVTLRFDQRGPASIVLKGVTERGDPTQVERNIVVK